MFALENWLRKKGLGKNPAYVQIRTFKIYVIPPKDISLKLIMILKLIMNCEMMSANRIRCYTLFEGKTPPF